MTENDKKIYDFLSSAPIFKPIQVETLPGSTVNRFAGKTFKCMCKKCNSDETFELFAFPKITYSSGNSQEQEKQVLLNVGYINGKYLHDSISGLPSLTQHYKGICKACNDYAVDMTLKTYSKKGKDADLLHFIVKVGQDPILPLSLDKRVRDYLSENDALLYETAVKCINSGWGIGAYAYFRIIIQNEIVKITENAIQDSDVTTDIKEKIETAYKDYTDLKKVSSLIDAILPAVPSSIKISGSINPIKFLWHELSESLHGGRNDVDCLESSKNINFVLSFVIEKLNEEKTEVSQLKAILREKTK